MSCTEKGSPIPKDVLEKNKVVPMPHLFDRCKQCDQILRFCKCSQLKNSRENPKKSKSRFSDESNPRIRPMPWLFEECKNCQAHRRLCSCPKEIINKEKAKKRNLETEELGIAPIFDKKLSKNININLIPPSPNVRPPSSKRSKMLPIKKELFKKPNEKKKSVVEKMVKTRNYVAKKTPVSSPLVSIEEVEEKLIHNEVSTFSNNNLEILTSAIKTDTPSDNNSENEFLLNEKQCLMESPVSSVCNLLKGTNIDSAKKPHKHTSDMIAAIEGLINEEIIEFNRYQKAHERRINALKHILNNMKDNCKENTPNRRSLRLAVKNTPLLRKNAVSPAIKKHEDLRKKALTNNLTTILSPKSACALTAFKGYKEAQASYLETPKSDKNKTLGLSNTLYEQIYELQDTPAHGN